MQTENLEIARRWLDAFNAHDVERLVSLYVPDATHTSPKIRVLYPESGGKIIGHEKLKAWWKDALQRLPSLRYEVFSLTADDSRVFMEYWRYVEEAMRMPVAEVFEVHAGKIVASRVYHG